jgi:hypothetical protein
MNASASFLLLAVGLLAAYAADPQPGEPCHTLKNGRLACGGNTWCSTSRKEPICEEACHNTATRKARQIPRKFKYFCDYGKEKPLKNGGSLEDRLPLPGFACDVKAMLPVPDEVNEKCLASGNSVGGSFDAVTVCHIPEGCDPSAWCHIGHMMCEERCYSTKTRNGGKIPRKKGWYNLLLLATQRSVCSKLQPAGVTTGEKNPKIL